MKLGDKIKKYREENRMTQRDIAEILEVEPGTVSKYESGMLEPNIESIKRLSDTFEITIDELLKDDDEKIDISKINVLEVLREQKEMKLKGNLYQAFRYNMLIFILTPFLMFFIFDYIISRKKQRDALYEKIPNSIWYILIIVLVIFGIIRNIFPFFAPTII